ncbi:uncharacterized protein LOC135685729 isoform X2 [Rhopilema esculentum]|uniref:uncharacterized protein LOC135685729 isoform X2 n=1 Tax=Rhopilema esculentum TaxID=499914 RepID=UPI0031D4FD42
MSVFNSELADEIEKAVLLMKNGESDNAVKVLKQRKQMPANQVAESWLCELCIITCRIKTEKFERSSDITNYRKQLLELLAEEQGTPCSVLGSITELCSICNILSLDLVERNSFLVAGNSLKEDVGHHLATATIRVMVLASNSFQKKAEILNRSQSCSTPDIVSLITECCRMLQNAPGEQSKWLSMCLVHVSIMVMMLLSSENQGQAFEKLVLELFELTRRIKIQDPSISGLVAGALLQQAHIEDFEHQLSSLAGLFQMISKREEAAKNLIEKYQGYKNTSKLLQLLTAYTLLKENNFMHCSVITQALCCQLKQEGDENDSLLFSNALNVLGICYFEMEKPNIACRLFEKSSRTFPRNRAPLKNLLLTLEVLNQFEIKLDCIHQALRLVQSDCQMPLTGHRVAFRFEEIFVLKLCAVVSSRFQGTRLCGNGDRLCLYLPCLDERQLLRDLAGCLFQQKRFKEASRAYLSLIRKSRQCCFSGNSDENGNLVLLFHQAIDALMKAKLHNQGLVLCNYILQFPACVTTLITNSTGKILQFYDDVITLVYKSEILMHLGKDSEALSVLQSITSTLEENIGIRQPLAKRSKFEVGIPVECICTLKLDELKTKLYNNTGVALTATSASKEALDQFKNAVKSTKDTIDDIVIFNYCKLLFDQGMKGIALRNWHEVYNENVSLADLKEKLSNPFSIHDFSCLSAEVLKDYS